MLSIILWNYIKINIMLCWFHTKEYFGSGIAGLIMGLHPANERRRYKVTPSLIGWAQT